MSGPTVSRLRVRRRQIASAIALFALVCAPVSCTTGSSAGADGTSPGTAISTTSTPAVIDSPTSSSGTEVMRGARFCMLDKPPASLAAALARGVVHFPAGVLGISSVLTDGTLVVNTKHGLDLMRPRETTARPVYHYPTASAFGLMMEETETDGYLVTRDIFNNESNTDWAMVATDLATGDSRVIGRPEPGIGDDLMAITPVSGDGFVAWSQARSDMSLEVEVFDLHAGVTRRAPWRDIAFPTIVGDVLLVVYQPDGDWQSRTGAYLVALDLHTLQPVPLPAGLVHVTQPRTVQVTPAGVLWMSNYDTIHAISADNPDLLLTANGTNPGYSAEDWPYLSDDGFAGWYQNGGGDGSGVFADLRTGVAVPLANHIYIAGTTVVAETIEGHTLVDSVFSTKDLPRLTGCSPTPMSALTRPASAPPLIPLDGENPPAPASP